VTPRRTASSARTRAASSARTRTDATKASSRRRGSSRPAASKRGGGADAADLRARILRWATFGAAGFVALSLVTTLIVLPVRDTMRQRAEIAERRVEFEALADANEKLVDDVDYLASPEGLIASARSELGFLFPGEKQVTILEMPDLPTNLPAEWPYSMVSNIVSVRAQNR
jgi:hypothetical protein